MSASSAAPSASPAPRAAPAVGAMVPEGLNLVVLHGRVSSPPSVRTLASGTRLVSFSLRVPTNDGVHTSVPVAAWDPAAWVEDIDTNDALVLTGMARRRFFRVGGATSARVEVEVVAIGRAGDRRRRAAVATRARRVLDDLE